MLPTLGARILPSIKVWITATTDVNASTHLRGVGLTLRRLARDAPLALRELAISLLGHPDASIQRSACRVITEVPGRDALDPLWALDARLPAANDAHDHSLRHWAFEALAACVALDPLWLQRRIESSDPNAEATVTLAYLLAQLDAPEALRIWKASRDALVARLERSGREAAKPESSARAIGACMRRFRDPALLDRIPSWLTSSDVALAATALDVLTRLDPASAIRAIDRVSTSVFSGFKNWWLDELLQQDRVTALAAITRRLRLTLPAEAHAGRVVQGYEVFISGEVLDALLDNLGAALAAQRASGSRSDDLLWLPLQIVSKVSRLDLIRTMRARAGTLLEQELVAFLVPRLDRDGITHDWTLENGLRLLLLIGGEGMGTVLIAALRSQSAHERSRAALMAELLPSTVKRAALRDLAGIAQGSDDRFGEARWRALRAVMADDDVEATCDAVIRWGIDVAREAVRCRPRRPLSEAELKGALDHAAGGKDPAASRWLILGISGRNDAAGRIRTELASAKSSPAAIRAALFALGALRDAAPEVDAIIRSALADRATRLEAIRTARALDAPSANQILKAFAAAMVARTPIRDELDFDVIREAYPVRDARAPLAQRLWGHIQGGGELWHRDSYIRCLGALTDPEVVSYLWERAAGYPGNPWDGPARIAALEALAEVDPGEAFAIAKGAFRGQTSEKAVVAGILLSCDAVEGFPVIFDYLSDEPEGKARWAIARLLRPHRAAVEGAVARELGARRPRRRRTAAEVAGWMGIGFLSNELRRLGSRDPDWGVASAATHALHRQENEHCASELLARLASEPAAGRWGLVEAIVTLADPFLLLSPGDACSLVGTTTEILSPLLWDYIDARLKSRRSDVESEAWLSNIED